MVDMALIKQRKMMMTMPHMTDTEMMAASSRSERPVDASAVESAVAPDVPLVSVAAVLTGAVEPASP